MADLQARADEGQDKHGYRGDVHKCVLCGQPVVSVCDDPDMGGNGVTCHYEPATEDEKAMRIAELVAELATLHSRLEFTSCQKEDVEAQVLEIEEQNSALRQDAAVGRAVIKGARFGSVALASIHSSLWIVKYREDSEPPVCREAHGNSPKAALVAAGLVENTDGTD